ncbi:D-2-hydroxyacid dehydrogenase [Roseomonas sp. SSH11]|uniref:D-2-hydroxyacid dehydrogenase n=2 Tax=Pararoseomonas baculiformis TaxID=2820812 RepID=A0ABS4AGH8_9PROT|nr:D-2-hydroxyacid dehydrogenase [Pararoseomonas baculiformis]MBP0445969.1 D-2-hydroxyacid dehydrogenase [Pararoseomonas baculiformis]
MRIHVQNPANDPEFAITQAQWDAAIARSPDMAGLQVSFADSEEGFASALPEAEILLSWVRPLRQRFPAGALPGVAPRLKVIACTSAGVDSAAPFDWLPDSVALLNNRGTHAEKAGEFGIMAILMLQTGMPIFADQQRRGEWKPRFSSTLEGRRVVIVGLGSLGGGVARRAKQFGMTVIGVRNGAGDHPDCDETHSTDALDRVLPQAEFLVLACPLTDRTRNLLSRERIALLPSGARIVNIARGAVWDQDAVCDALDAGHLEGCVTDVAVPEPLPAEHRLWRTPGMVVTPHVSADDHARYNDRTLDILFENLRAMREGRPMPNRVDPAKGY